jgi:tRNA pseudouridine65 synthase
LTTIEVVYEDDALIAVNKPAGLLVHRSAIAADERDFLLERLREQTGAALYLAHRLDRATSGIVLLAKSREIAGDLGKQFMARSIDKIYLAVVRGWPMPLARSTTRCPTCATAAAQAGVTTWRVLATATVPIELGRYPEQRYALIEASPQTGRYRQIRKHMHHVSHTSSATPATAAATTTGCGACTGVHRLLHAWRLLDHPLAGAADAQRRSTRSGNACSDRWDGKGAPLATSWRIGSTGLLESTGTLGNHHAVIRCRLETRPA